MYQLHLHPSAHARVVSELNSIFEEDGSKSTADQLKANPHLINKLEYTTAVIKETLRLHSPASTIRYLPPDGSPKRAQVTFTDPETGQVYPLTGFHIWPVAIAIHRNEEFFPEPVKFVPERFIPHLNPYPQSKLFSTTPTSVGGGGGGGSASNWTGGRDAFRAFEKGPRNCIGQGLALLETQIICALILRDFDFVAEFDGQPVQEVVEVESVNEYDPPDNVTVGTWGKRKTIEGHRCYQTLKGSAKPVDGMPGRVRLR